MLIRALQDCRIHIIWCVPKEIYSRGNNLLPIRQILLFFDLNSLISIQHRNIHPWSARRPLAVIINAVLKMILTRARSACSLSDPAFLLKKLQHCPCDYTQTKQFLFAGNRSPQLKTISKVSRRSFVRSSGNAFHQLTICALFCVEAGTRHGHLK